MKHKILPIITWKDCFVAINNIVIILRIRNSCKRTLMSVVKKATCGPISKFSVLMVKAIKCR